VDFSHYYRLHYKYNPRVLFRWCPSRGTDLATFEDHADEYIVVGRAAAEAGVIVYARYGERWEVNCGERFVIAELLRRAGVEVSRTVDD